LDLPADGAETVVSPIIGATRDAAHLDTVLGIVRDRYVKLSQSITFDKKKNIKVCVTSTNPTFGSVTYAPDLPVESFTNILLSYA